MNESFTLSGMAMRWITLALILVSFYCLHSELKQEGQHAPRLTLKPWSISPLNFVGFFLFTCGLVLIVNHFLNVALTNLNPVLSVLFETIAFDLIILLIPLGIWHLSPQFFEDFTLNVRQLSLGKAFKTALWHFCSTFILVAIVSFLWQFFLTSMYQKGFLHSIGKQQAIISYLEKLQSPWVIFGFVVLIVVFAPIVEEIIFRGLLYRFFKYLNKPKLAMATSSLLFALAHNNLQSLLPIFFLGCLLTRAYEHSQNILVPIAFHAIFNGQSVFLIFLTR